MNKIFLEHSGTSYYNGLAQDISDLLEYHFNLDVEVMIGESYGPLTLYTINMEEIVELTAVPKKESLRLLLSLNGLI